MGKATGQLDKLSQDIDQNLEQILSREKYVNSQFEPSVLFPMT